MSLDAPCVEAVEIASVPTIGGRPLAAPQVEVNGNRSANIEPFHEAQFFVRALKRHKLRVLATSPHLYHEFTNAELVGDDPEFAHMVDGSGCCVIF